MKKIKLDNQTVILSTENKDINESLVNTTKKRIRILKEQKFFKIETPAEYLTGFGDCEYIPSKLYYDEPFISEEDCNTKLELALKRHMGAWRVEKPILTIYWKVLEETIQTEVES